MLRWARADELRQAGERRTERVPGLLDAWLFLADEEIARSSIAVAHGADSTAFRGDGLNARRAFVRP
jgi:hypothetical protein